MKSIVRLAALVMSLIFCVGVFAGCNGKLDIENDPNKKTIVCTMFPEYDWTKQVLGELRENYNLTLLMDNGADLHNYQPTAENIARIAKSDLFIYVGGESDSWVEGALKEAVNPDMQVINLMEVLENEIKEEEAVEGMQEEKHEHEHGEGHEHGEDEEHSEGHERGEKEEHSENHEHGENEEHGEGHEHGEDEEHSEEIEFDEHVWLSLRDAKIVVEEIEKALEIIDAENADIYKKNAETYVKELSDLDKRYEEMVENASTKTMIFGDRFPFRYFADDYGLEYFAAFSGCSAETNASFETIIFLSEKCNEINAKRVFVLENSDGRVAQGIINATERDDISTAVLNSMQSVTWKDVENGVTYLQIMEDNFVALEEAL